jgi:hypothetical protein
VEIDNRTGAVSASFEFWSPVASPPPTLTNIGTNIVGPGDCTGMAEHLELTYAVEYDGTEDAWLVDRRTNAVTRADFAYSSDRTRLTLRSSAPEVAGRDWRCFSAFGTDHSGSDSAHFDSTTDAPLRRAAGQPVPSCDRRHPALRLAAPSRVATRRVGVAALRVTRAGYSGAAMTVETAGKSHRYHARTRRHGRRVTFRARRGDRLIRVTGTWHGYAPGTGNLCAGSASRVIRVVSH